MHLLLHFDAPRELRALLVEALKNLGQLGTPQQLPVVVLRLQAPSLRGERLEPVEQAHLGLEAVARLQKKAVKKMQKNKKIRKN
jgi:hypothetical protein